MAIYLIQRCLQKSFYYSLIEHSFLEWSTQPSHCVLCFHCIVRLVSSRSFAVHLANIEHSKTEYFMRDEHFTLIAQLSPPATHSICSESFSIFPYFPSVVFFLPVSFTMETMVLLSESWCILFGQVGKDANGVEA